MGADAWARNDVVGCLALTCSGGGTDVGCDNDEFGWGERPILPGDPTDGIALIDSGTECWLREHGVLPPVDLVN